jgi:hypothetical protein
MEQTLSFFEGLMGARRGRGGVWSAFDDVARIVSRRRVRGAFAGALALNAHGVARSTADVDFLVHPEHRSRLLEGLAALTRVVQDYDTMVILEHQATGVEIDVLVAFDAISLEACSDPARSRVAGRLVPVVDSIALAAMKTVAAVDSPAIEPKQRADLVAMVRAGVVDVNAVSRRLQDDAGSEYARYFVTAAKEAKAHRFAPPRQKLPVPLKTPGR